MTKFCKSFAALFLALALLAGLAMPASAVNSGECGLRVGKNDSYSKDGKYYLSFNITGGSPPGTYSASAVNTSSAKVVDASGKTVFSWGEYEFGAGKTVTRNYGADYSKLATGAYTFKLTVRTKGWTDYSAQYGGYGTQYNYGFTWSYTINHTQSASVSLNKVEVVYRDDGSYANKFTFGHSGAKGQVLNMEIYDQWGSRVYSVKGSSPISYTSGTYSFTWGGYPSGGGTQCDSGEYTIKYWLGGKNAKQSKQYLSIY